MQAFSAATDQRETDSSANNTVSARNWKLEECSNHQPNRTAHCKQTRPSGNFCGVTLGTGQQQLQQDLPRDAKQPNISSFSAPSYKDTSRIPFLIVSDTLYPATDTASVTSTVCRVCSRSVTGWDDRAALEKCSDVSVS
jgi:hypothetical protein